MTLLHKTNSLVKFERALIVLPPMFVSTILLSLVTDAAALDILYETISATATVGLTRNLTGILNAWGKIIIIFTMYLGRVGPISLAFMFKSRKETVNIVKNPTEEISVG